jgi:hypothetical protein
MRVCAHTLSHSHTHIHTRAHTLTHAHTRAYSVTNTCIQMPEDHAWRHTYSSAWMTPCDVTKSLCSHYVLAITRLGKTRPLKLYHIMANYGFKWTQNKNYYQLLFILSMFTSTAIGPDMYFKYDLLLATNPNCVIFYNLPLYIKAKVHINIIIIICRN